MTLSAMWELIAKLPAQKILTTNSGELLAAVPLRSIRRIVTDRFGTRVYRIDAGRYSVDDLRRIAYHVRINGASALFARCWLFVEGETEAWLLPELAQIRGFDFPSEGIRCVEFAQSGLRALLRLGHDLRHRVAPAGRRRRGGAQLRRTSARAYLKGRPIQDRVTMLEEPDIEHCLFRHGYADIYRAWPARRRRRLAGGGPASGRRP